MLVLIRPWCLQNKDQSKGLHALSTEADFFHIFSIRNYFHLRKGGGGHGFKSLLFASLHDPHHHCHHRACQTRVLRRQGLELGYICFLNRMGEKAMSLFRDVTVRPEEALRGKGSYQQPPAPQPPGNSTCWFLNLSPYAAVGTAVRDWGSPGLLRELKEPTQESTAP